MSSQVAEVFAQTVAGHCRIACSVGFGQYFHSRRASFEQGPDTYRCQFPTATGLVSASQSAPCPSALGN